VLVIRHQPLLHKEITVEVVFIIQELLPLAEVVEVLLQLEVMLEALLLAQAVMEPQTQLLVHQSPTQVVEVVALTRAIMALVVLAAEVQVD
jgi:hypothetical protein